MSESVKIPILVVEEEYGRVSVDRSQTFSTRRESRLIKSETNKIEKLIDTEEQDITFMLQNMLTKAMEPHSTDPVNIEKMVEQSRSREKSNEEFQYHQDKLTRLAKLKQLLSENRVEKNEPVPVNIRKKSVFGKSHSLTGSIADPATMTAMGLVHFQPQAPIIIDDEDLNARFSKLKATEKFLNFKPRKNPVFTYVDIPGVLEVESDEKPIHVKRLDDNLKESFQELQRKVIRNPRFSNPDEKTLVAEPMEVLFDNYIPYKVFQQKLVIKNISKHSHRYRVTFDPPGEYPEFFTLSNPHTPVNDFGLIAPGLSAEYTITFKPNSFACTAERLIVQSELGERLVVPIVAAHEPPSISLPRVINVGNCMDTKELTFTHPITNMGGESRFMIMVPSVPLGPFELFDQLGPQNDAPQKTLTFGPFQIYPSYFRLRKGETVDLKIKYSPPLVAMKKGKKEGQRKDQQDIKIACDNCTMIDLRIDGTVMQPVIKFVNASVPKDGKEFFPRPCTGKGTDPNQAFDIDLGLENYGVPKMGAITIQNLIDVEVPFHWKLYDSNGEELGLDSKSETFFGISPPLGILHPLSELQVRVCFISNISKPKIIFAKLFASDDSNTKKDLKESQKTIALATLRLMGEAVQYEAYVNTNCIFIPAGIRAGDKFSQKISFTNSSLSDMDYKWEFNGLDSEKIVAKISDPIGEIKAKTCISLNVSLTGLFPGDVKGELRGYTANGIGPALIVNIVGKIGYRPGDLSISANYLNLGLVPLGLLKKLRVPLKNFSSVTMSWEAKMYVRNEASKDALFVVSPFNGMLNPGESQNLLITYIPLWYQQFRATLEIYALGSSGEKVFMSATDVIATTLTPKIMIENPINSMTCFVGASFDLKLSMKNTRSLPAYFSWSNIYCDEYSVEFEVLSGSIPPNDFFEITVKATFFITGSFEIDLIGGVECMVEDHGKLYAKIKAEAVEPFFRYRVLENEIAWKKKQVMDQVHEPRQDSDAHLRIDFGLACPMFVVRTRTLKIRNHSPIHSHFEINIESYPALFDETEPNIIQVVKKIDSKVPKLLQDTIEPQFGFSSKAGQAFVDGLNTFRDNQEKMKRILSHGKGAAFRAFPSKGEIAPWDEVEIQVFSYNNLVGTYEDRLICKVGKTTRILPVRLGVIGNTVKFTGPQLVALRDDNRGEMKFDLINFGSRVINPSLGESDGIRLCTNDINTRRLQSQAIKSFGHPSKTINVENHSPREIKLEWSVFVKHSSISQKVSTYAGDTPIGLDTDESKLSEVLKAENRLSKGDAGILDVTPPIMIIPPFKSAVLTCHFRNCALGVFEGLVLADVAYASDEGFVYSPIRSKQQGQIPKRGAVLHSDTCFDKITIDDLVSVAKLRIKGKCIEPKLTLDVGTKIRIKKNLRKGAIEEKVLKTISFLVNDSDAVCDFYLEAHPKEQFSVQASKSFIKQNKNGTVYELKQKQHMMITVTFLGKSEPFDHFPLPSITRPATAHNLERRLSIIESLRATRPSLSLNTKIKATHPELVSALPSVVDMMIPNSAPQTASSFSDTMASGYISIHFSNGMSQTIPIVVDGVYE